MLTYQVHQEKKGNLLFLISQSLTEEEEGLLKKEIERYFKGDISYRIQQQEELKKTKGKLKNFISTIL